MLALWSHDTFCAMPYREVTLWWAILSLWSVDVSDCSHRNTLVVVSPEVTKNVRDVLQEEPPNMRQARGHFESFDNHPC